MRPRVVPSRGLLTNLVGFVVVKMKTGVCLSDTCLKQFAVGKGSEVVEHHLDECSACQARLAKFDDFSDPLLETIRTVAVHLLATEMPAFVRRLRKAEAVGPAIWLQPILGGRQAGNSTPEPNER